MTPWKRKEAIGDVTLYCGDAREVMGRLLDEGLKVQMSVTSPPYWNLRDYGEPGQLGLEKTPQEYVKNLVEVFRLVRELLADDGTLWLNLGSSYTSGDRATFRSGVSENKGQDVQNNMARPKTPSGFKPKDMVPIPWMVAMALQADDWYLRQDIIWSKPNPMPESVRDRCTKSHEYVFLLSKRERYYYNADAIADLSVMQDIRKPYAPGQVDNRGNGHDRGGGQPRTRGKHADQSPRSAGTRIVENVARARAEGATHDNPFGETRNKRSVWTVTTHPYPDAHFATFPPALIEPCILAGSKPGEIVLDPFIGSGTTAEVCVQHARKCVGIELNEDYLLLRGERIENAQRQQRMFT